MGKYVSKQFSPRIYPEWGELISDLSPEKQAQIFNAILKYPNEDVDSGVWRFIKSQIDKDYLEFVERANKNKETIQNYWKKKETTVNDGKQSLSNVKQTTTDENDGKPITRTRTDNDKRNISVATCFEKQAERLADIVTGLKNIKVTGQKIASWAKSFEQLNRIEGVAIERIDDALDWYSKHAGEEFIPVIESGSSFREKFTKIEAAQKRTNTASNFQDSYCPAVDTEKMNKMASIAEITLRRNIEQAKLRYGA